MVISVGRLDPIKNVLVLAQAVRTARPIGGADRAPAVRRARGPTATRVIALLGDRATCPGVLDPATLARAYASADLCAQPAVIEELSNAVLEASSSGLPLLVAAGSGSERFVVEGRDGAGRARGDAGGVGGRARRTLLRDPARLAAMGREARAWSLDARPDLAPGADRGSAAGLAAPPSTITSRQVEAAS